jgi:hypothetical protein
MSGVMHLFPPHAFMAWAMKTLRSTVGDLSWSSQTVGIYFKGDKYDYP